MTLLTNLQKSFEHHGLTSRKIAAGDGTLLVTPYGARIMACAIEGVEGNLFWHHPNVEDPKKAGANIKAAGGILGGDRLWLAPEIGFHWPSLKKARVKPWDDYIVPPRVDPGHYVVTEESLTHLRLAAQALVFDYRIKKRITLNMGRQFDVIAAPSGLPKGLKVSSFAIRNDLTVLRGDEGAVVGAWDILQVPAGGTLICPLVQPIKKPRIYYGTFDAQRMKVNKDAVKFTLDGKRQLKLGLTAEQSAGRMGYLRSTTSGTGKGKVTTLIARIWAVAPGEPYVDLPLTSDDLIGGDTLQSYNDGGEFGGFGEMEYHDPGIVIGKTPLSRSATSVTHIIAGPDAAVRKAATMLLGVSV